MGFQDFFGRKPKIPKTNGPPANASVFSTSFSSAFGLRSLLGTGQAVPVSFVEYNSTDMSIAGTHMDESNEIGPDQQKPLGIELLDFCRLHEESTLQKKTFTADFGGPNDWMDHFLKKKKSTKKASVSKVSKTKGGATKQDPIDPSKDGK